MNASSKFTLAEVVAFVCGESQLDGDGFGEVLLAYPTVGVLASPNDQQEKANG